MDTRWTLLSVLMLQETPPLVSSTFLRPLLGRYSSIGAGVLFSVVFYRLAW